MRTQTRLGSAITEAAERIDLWQGDLPHRIEALNPYDLPPPILQNRPFLGRNDVGLMRPSPAAGSATAEGGDEVKGERGGGPGSADPG